jgi:uncharacterized protein (TIRG00374 family)
MEKYLKYSIVLLVLVFVGYGLITGLTGALPIILSANPYFFSLAVLFFLGSIVLWIIPWALLLKNNKKVTIFRSIIIGFSCVYGALTPVQVGSEALRSIKAKEYFGVSYSNSVSAAMVVKGLKFFMLAVLSSMVIWVVLFETQLSIVALFGLLSGFSVIILASALFLLPLNKKIGLMISAIFGELGKVWKPFFVLKKYFQEYSNYLQIVPKKNFLIVLVLSGLSLVFEFIALMFCFFALNVFIEVFPLAFLFIIISVLERTPIIPRGVGLVEAAGFIFLAMPEFSKIALTVPQIAAILILYGVVRLFIPTILSLLTTLIKIKK